MVLRAVDVVTECRSPILDPLLGASSIEIQLFHGGTKLAVVAGANCELKNGITQWAFVVTCPSGPPKPQASPNPEKK